MDGIGECLAILCLPLMICGSSSNGGGGRRRSAVYDPSSEEAKQEATRRQRQQPGPLNASTSLSTGHRRTQYDLSANGEEKRADSTKENASRKPTSVVRGGDIKHETKAARNIRMAESMAI